jgi:hypothetical protein
MAVGGPLAHVPDDGLGPTNYRRFPLLQLLQLLQLPSLCLHDSYYYLSCC